VMMAKVKLPLCLIVSYDIDDDDETLIIVLSSSS